ncbi:hypothetical protein J4E83_009199 [Alternaria metachromatica]|uniref:uncharacterized protein n=1 Tax=Alternaria metachromatica TaxID=283354 RepID=UPI0020C509C2|nr:uncharacterized protein J4E83_009199 [Alternaria metachromatica]KAI4608394.1 hypothetical protein J4E83_009199 [Alternaria metachromatica]
MNGQPIPGYFWDAEKKKYFRIQTQTAAQGSNLKYSSANIKKTERKERIQNVALARSNKLKKERVVRRNTNSFAQTNIDREIGLKRRSRYVHGLWPDACAAGIQERPEKVLPPCGLRLFAKDPVHHTIYAVQVSSLSFLPATGALAVTTYGSDRPPEVWLSDPGRDDPYVGQKFTPKDCSAIWGAAARPTTFTASPGLANSVAATWTEHLAVAASSSMLLFTRSQGGAWDSQAVVKSLESDLLALEWISYTTVALGCRDGTIRLYDTRSGGSSHVLTHPAPIAKLKRADDETRLICSGLNDTLFLYDIRSPRLSRNSSRKMFNYDNHHYNEEYFKNLYPTHRDSHKRRKLNHKAFKNWSQPVMTFAHLNRDELELDIDVYPRLGLLAAAQDTTEGTVIRISNIWTGKSVKEIDPGSTHQAKIRALKFIESGFDGNVDLWSCWETFAAIIRCVPSPKAAKNIMSNIDLEKCTATYSSTRALPSTNPRTSNIKMRFPILIAYIGLYVGTYYLSPTGPGSEHRDGDSGRIPPLAIVLTLLGPELIQKAFAVTTAISKTESPCFGFGWLAYSLSLLSSVTSISGDVMPKPECDVKVLDMSTGKRRSNKEFAVARLLRDLEYRSTSTSVESYMDPSSDIVVEILQPTGISSASTSFRNLLQSGSLMTVILQFCLAGAFWFYYGDLSPLLLLSISILLIEATASLPVWTAQKTASSTRNSRDGTYALMRDTDSPPSHIYIIQPSPTASTNAEGMTAHHDTSTNASNPCVSPIILIAGAFLSQALLYTQLSDNAAIAMLLIMFVGTISNIAIVAVPRVPQVDGAELRSVGVMKGEGSVVEVLKGVEAAFEGYGDVLLKQCFPEMIGNWESGIEKVKMGEMD